MKKLLVTALFIVVAMSGVTQAAGDAVAGKEKSQTCVACHGDTGVSPTPQFPIIAGQYKDYLYKSLKDYKAGVRKNPIMAGIVAALEDQDMQDLAAFYASQEGLGTISLP